MKTLKKSNTHQLLNTKVHFRSVIEPAGGGCFHLIKDKLFIEQEGKLIFIGLAETERKARKMIKDYYSETYILMIENL